MIEAKVAGLVELSAALKGIQRKIDINVAAAINKTAKKVTTFAARELKKTLPVPVRVLKKALRSKGRASPQKLYAIVVINQGYAIPLRYFSPKKTKSGVTYRTVKGGQRSINRSAFMPPRYGGRVYVRKGTERGPLQQLYGPSPSEAFRAAGLETKVREFAQSQLPIEIKERIRLALLREAGVVKQRKYG